MRASDAVRDGAFGVRGSDGRILAQVRFGATFGWYRRFTLDFTPSKMDVVTVFVGLSLPGPDAWLQVDDLWMTNTTN
jgi:hypothetical protein